MSGRDLGSAAREVRDTLVHELDLPPGYFVDVGGKVESQARAQQALQIAVGLALLALPVFYQLVHNLDVRWRARQDRTP